MGKRKIGGVWGFKNVVNRDRNPTTGERMFEHRTWKDPFKVTDVMGTYKRHGKIAVKKSVNPTLQSGKKMLLTNKFKKHAKKTAIDAIIQAKNKFLTKEVKNQAKLAAKSALLNGKKKFLTKETKNRLIKTGKRMIKTGVNTSVKNFTRDPTVQFKTKEAVIGWVSDKILDMMVGMVLP